MLVNWFHYQPLSASRVHGSNLNWSLHLSWWIANLQTSPSRCFSRKGPPPFPGARRGCSGGDPGYWDIFISPELGRGRTAWFPPDAARSSGPKPPRKTLGSVPSQALLSLTASAIVLWHPARIRQFLPSPHPARALVLISSLALPKPRAQQSEQIWAPYLDYVMRIRKREPLKERRRIGAEETHGWWVESPG